MQFEYTRQIVSLTIIRMKDMNHWVLHLPAYYTSISVSLVYHEGNIDGNQLSPSFIQQRTPATENCMAILGLISVGTLMVDDGLDD